MTFDSGATIALAPAVRMVDACLEDEISGHRYPVAGAGSDILKRLAEGTPVGEVVTSIARNYDVPSSLVAGDLESFLIELDGQALISTRQSYLAGVRAFFHALSVAVPSPLDLLMVDTSGLGQPARRYPPSLLSVVRACIEAQTLLYATALCLIMAAVAVKLIVAWEQQSASLDVAIYAAARPVLAIAIFALLFICHESGHLFALRALHMQPRSVASKMWAVGITYVAGRPFQMLIVALAGPLSAFVVAMALALFLSDHPLMSLGGGNLEVSYVILFGLLHLWSLRPWAQDGRQAAGSLFALARQRTRAQSREGAA
jgi:hypothetical protein